MIELLTGIYAIEVPVGANVLGQCEDTLCYIMGPNAFYIDLTEEGEFDFLFCSLSATEEQAITVVGDAPWGKLYTSESFGKSARIVVR